MYLPLNRNGKFITCTIVDDDDWEKIKDYRWGVTTWGYVRAYRQVNGGQKAIYMHKLLLGIQDSDLQGDHINFDRLDNRKSNLRVATRSENRANRRTGWVKGISGYRGVTWYDPYKIWRVRVKVEKREIFTSVVHPIFEEDY